MLKITKKLTSNLKFLSFFNVPTILVSTTFIKDNLPLKIAINKLRSQNKNYKLDELYAASDAFFPFTDGIEELVLSGVKAIIQPSGSINDKEIIKFANKLGIILVFSKTRHFRH